MFEFRKKAQLVFSHSSPAINIKKTTILIGREKEDRIGETVLLVDRGKKVSIIKAPMTSYVSRKHGELIWDKKRRRYNSRRKKS